MESSGQGNQLHILLTMVFTTLMTELTQLHTVVMIC
jgi:hypothetical protein